MIAMVKAYILCAALRAGYHPQHPRGSAEWGKADGRSGDHERTQSA